MRSGWLVALPLLCCIAACDSAPASPLQYNEIAGAGHVPFPGDPTVPLDFCRAQALP